MALDVTQPIDLVEVKKLVRSILDSDEGLMVFTPHADEELEKDGLIHGDVLSVLRGGIYQEPEWVKEAWRYKAVARRITIVFELDSETCCVVVTAWRSNK